MVAGTGTLVLGFAGARSEEFFGEHYGTSYISGELCC